MSEKKSREDRKLKLMTEEAGIRKTANEMASSIHKMYEDRDKKALSAKKHLAAQLEVTVDKYRTANGVMSALQTVRTVFGDKHGMCGMDVNEEIAIAKTAASRMAGVVQAMYEKLETLAPEEADKLCDGFYAVDFSSSDASALEMIDELMSLQLCQNVGPDASDIVEFITTADEEIEKAKENLMKYCENNDLDYLEVCGEKSE